MDLPQRQMRLQFREQVSLTPSFAHWLETLTNPEKELRFSNARAALEALQASGSPSSSLLTVATGSQETNRKARQRTINIAVLQYVVLFVAAIVLPSMLHPGNISKTAEAKQNVGSMNRAQAAYFLESNEFADSIQEVGIGIRTQTKNYQYSIRATPLTAFEYGVSRKDNLKSYVGGVFLTSDLEAKGEIVTVAIICETESRGRKRPAEPIVRGNVVECAPSTKSLGYTGPIVLEKDSALAYHSLNYAVAGQYDQALQVAKTIKHPHFKATVKVAETIEDDSAKQRAMEAIASYRKSQWGIESFYREVIRNPD